MLKLKGISHGFFTGIPLQGSGDSSVVRVPDLWSKSRGLESWQDHFFPPGSTFCALISVSVPPKIPVILLKVQVAATAKHTCTLHIITGLHEMMWHGCMANTEHAKMAAVSRGASPVTIKNAVRTLLGWIVKMCYKKQQSLFRITCDKTCSASAQG